MKFDHRHAHLNVKTFLRYSLVGLSGTVVDFGVLILLVEVFSVSPISANIVSFLLAVGNNFFWNKHWTFKNKEKKFTKQLTQFFVVSLVGLLINIILLPALIHAGLWYVFAKIIIIAIVVMWNFLGNALWTFRKLGSGLES